MSQNNNSSQQNWSKNNQQQSSNSNNSNSNRSNQKLQQLKQETANELGINLNDNNLTAREAGRVGGNMVKKMVEESKNNQNY